MYKIVEINAKYFEYSPKNSILLNESASKIKHKPTPVKPTYNKGFLPTLSVR